MFLKNYRLIITPRNIITTGSKLMTKKSPQPLIYFYSNAFQIYETFRNYFILLNFLFLSNNYHWNWVDDQKKRSLTYNILLFKYFSDIRIINWNIRKLFRLSNKPNSLRLSNVSLVFIRCFPPLCSTDIFRNMSIFKNKNSIKQGLSI